MNKVQHQCLITLLNLTIWFHGNNNVDLNIKPADWSSSFHPRDSGSCPINYNDIDRSYTNGRFNYTFIKINLRILKNVSQLSSSVPSSKGKNEYKVPKFSVCYVRHELRFLRPWTLHFDLHRNGIRLLFSLRHRQKMQSLYLHCRPERWNLHFEKRSWFWWKLSICNSVTIVLYVRLHTQTRLGWFLPKHLFGEGYTVDVAEAMQVSLYRLTNRQ